MNNTNTLDLVGYRIMEILARMGYCYKLNNGELSNVRFSRRWYTSNGHWFVYELDTINVPHKVKIANCISPDALHELGTCLGYHVYKLNTTRAAIAVEVQTNRVKLPTAVPFAVVKDLPPYSIPLGVSQAGPQYVTLPWTSHILVGGESRSGKSTWLNAMLLQLISTHTDKELQLVIFDPKGVDFIRYGGLPHLHGKAIAVTPEQSVATAHWLLEKMNKRQTAFQSVYAKKLSEYNEKVDEENRLPMIVAVLDEVTDLSLMAGDDFIHPLTRLASKGASFGIVLVLSTQNPRFDVLPTLIKGNMSTRIAFRVTTVSHSQVILGTGGAEKLPRLIRGRLVARYDTELLELQGVFATDEQVIEITNELRGYEIQTVVPTPAFTLSDLERRMVVWAVQKNNRKFNIRAVADAFAESTKAEVERLAKYWSSLNFLTKDGGAYVVTIPLAALAGV